MTKTNLFMNILFLIIAIILCAIPRCLSVLSDKRLCYDSECSVPVSLAWTTLSYNPREPGLLSFGRNVNVTVYSKGAGIRKDLWGIEVNGKRGYAPESFLKEYKVLKKNLTHEVSTVKLNEEGNNTQVSENSKPKENDALNLPVKDNEKSSSINDDSSVLKSADENVKQSLVNVSDISSSRKVIEGTTIHIENNESALQPSSVTQSVQTTAVPSEQPLNSNAPSKNSPTENLDSKENQIHDVSSNETKEILKSSELTNDVILEETQNTAPLLDTNTSRNLSDTDHKTDYKLESNQANKNGDEGAKEPSESNKKFHVQKRIEKEKEEDELKKGHVKRARSTEKVGNNISPLGMILSQKVQKQDLASVKTENIVEEIPKTSKSKLEEIKESVDNIDVKVVESPIAEESSVQEEEKEVPKSEETKEELSVDIFKDSSSKVPDTSVQEEIKKTADISVQSVSFSAENNSISGQDQIIDVPPTDANEEVTKVEEKEKTDTSSKVNVDNDLQQSIAVNIDSIDNQEVIVNNTVNSNNNLLNDVNSVDVPIETTEFPKDMSDKINLEEQEQLDSSQINVSTEQISNLKEFQHNRNLLNVEESIEIENAGHEMKSTVIDVTESLNSEALPEYGDSISDEDKVSYTSTDSSDIKQAEEIISRSFDAFTIDGDCPGTDTDKDHEFLQEDRNSEDWGKTIMTRVKMKQNYWETFMYLGVTAFTTLFFSLGYYFIENKRRDGELIAKINKLEKELLVSMKECTILSESLKTTKEKLNSIEDESFGSNEMVLSLKADLEVSQNAKAELEDQVVMLEKDLESATEAGLELERMLREVLSSNNEVNPLAQSVEDLQTRLNDQQAANESLTNALNLKTQENEALSADLALMKQKCEELEVELMQVSENLKAEINLKNSLEHMSSDKIQQLEFQVKQLSLEKLALQKDLKGKIAEVEDLAEVLNQVNSNDIDLNKLFDVSHIKAEATQLLEERDELKVQLSEVEGAHHLLEEHMKLIKEEISALSDQCRQAEKEKKDAETRLEVLSNFFKEKETQRQKEEAIWLQKQGEVMSTVERIHTLQNELQSYKQQIEMLKREIVDQEREYKSQISLLETKAHEQWVVARQNERRLEESKTEAAQLRNRLTMIEKNLSEVDPETKLHRLEANGETATSPPLFIGAESSSSPIMFTGSSGVPPPPPPSYVHCSLFPPYLPPPLPSGSGVPPYEVGQRPPPLGGRLSSPPPMPLHPPASSRYDNAGSPPPPMSPHLLPPFSRHRSPPPPFVNDHVHLPPPPPPGSILPPPLGTSHSWGEESLPPLRNSGFHPHQREQRARNHKGSLHSSGESLDKTHHSGKV